MKNTTVTVIYKNARHRILKIEAKYYLIDLNRSWVGFILPFLSWLFPHTVTELPEKDALKLITMTDLKLSEGKKTPFLFTLGMVTVLGKLTDRLMDGLVESLVLPIHYGFLLLIPAIIGGIFIRFFHFDGRSKRALLKATSLEGQPTRKLLIFPASMKGLLLPFGVYLVFLIFMIIGAWATIDTRSVIMLMGFALFFTFFLFTSSTAVFIGKYKVIFLDSKKHQQDTDIA